jgi:uncharacterized protein YbjQ (UPF0145 family)
MPEYRIRVGYDLFIEKFTDETVAYKQVKKRGYEIDEIELATDEVMARFPGDKININQQRDVDRQRRQEEKVTKSGLTDEARHIQEEEHKEAREREINAKVRIAKETGDWSEISASIIEKITGDITLTSSFYISNHEVDTEIEFITAECVYGMNIFKDFFAGVRDIFGGRSHTVQKVLRDARRTCLTELRREALMVGADAVISINLNYQELSAGQKNGMLMLVASGTAVRLKKRINKPET